MNKIDTDSFRTDLNAQYDKGLAVMQYVITRDNFVARYRGKTYEMPSFKKLALIGNIENWEPYGLYLAPIENILKVPGTVEINLGENHG